MFDNYTSSDPRYVSVEDVRDTCGIKEDLIDDDSLNRIIARMEFCLESFLSTKFSPFTVVELIEGNGSERIFVKNRPVNRVFEVNIDGTSIDVDTIRVDGGAGLIWLTGSSATTVFSSSSTEQFLCRVKYQYSDLVYDTVQTSVSTAVSVGSAVSVEVGDTSDFSADDFVELAGLDGRKEVCKISSITDGTNFVADYVMQSHEVDSVVTKMKVSDVVKRMIMVNCAMACVARVVGASYQDITSYGLGEFQTTKGEPYTQWRETNVQLRNEWKQLQANYKPKIMVV